MTSLDSPPGAVAVHSQPAVAPTFYRLWLPVICFALPVAYMASGTVYKIWYICTAVIVVVLYIAWLRRLLSVEGIFRCSAPQLFYYFSILFSVLVARNTETTLLWLAIDIIYLFVFWIFFVAGRNIDSGTIRRAMQFMVPPALLTSFIFFSEDADRVGISALNIMVIAVPFLVAGVFRNQRGSLLLLVAAFLLLTVSQSRTPLFAAVITALISVAWMAPGSKQLLRFVSAAVLLAAAILVVAAQFEEIRHSMARTWVRASGQEVVAGNDIIEPEPPDKVRIRIGETSAELLSERRPLGIGYMNFQEYYFDRYSEFIVLHSVYMTWILELGLVGCLAVAWIFWMFSRQIRDGLREGDDPDHWRSLAAAMCGVLAMGFFHQTHQLPALWMVLGLTAGSAARFGRTN